MSSQMTADKARQLLQKSKQISADSNWRSSAQSYCQNCLRHISAGTSYPHQNSHMSYVLPSQFADEVKEELLRRGFSVHISAFVASHDRLDISW